MLELLSLLCSPALSQVTIHAAVLWRDVGHIFGLVITTVTRARNDRYAAALVDCIEVVLLVGMPERNVVDAVLFIPERELQLPDLVFAEAPVRVRKLPAV